MIQFWGITSLGFFRYAGKFINFSSPIGFFVGLLETIAEFARLLSFSFRLFGNMLAGEILLLVMTFLIALCSPILVIFYGLGLFVGLIQGFVFATLTLVFAMGAVTAHGPEGHGEEGGHH
jgi:F-type H+-transporting ATPase subunit a